MACCSIRWCGKNSKKSNYDKDGITFHRFPKKVDLKEIWMACTKRENFNPSNYSVICSRHFTEDCFYTINSRRRLYHNAIPTLHLPIVGDTVVISYCAPLEGKNTTHPSSCHYEPILPMSKIKQEVTDPETPLQCNSLTKRPPNRRLLELSKKVKHKNKTIKDLRDQVRYYKKKVISMKLKIKELEKKNLIKPEDTDILNTEIVQRYFQKY